MSDGTGRIYQRGDVWWIDYGFRGERYRESSKSHRKKDARALLKKRMAEMGNGKLVGPSAEKVRFEDLKEAHLSDLRVNNRTTSWAKTGWKHLTEHFANSRALDITTGRLRRYIEARQKEDAANSSIKRELACLRRGFNLAVQDGRLNDRPHFPSIKVDNARTGFFEPGELEKVIEELPDPLKPVTRFAALTGWRKSEVLGLKWADVDFDAGEVRLWESKNDEPRLFPFGVLPPLRKLLEEQRERTRALERERGEIIPHVFHRKGKEIKSINGAWRGATKRAGLDGWYFHDLRRTAVRNLERAGVSRSVAMKLTGHKTEAVYRRYAIADKAALDEGVEKLAQLHADQDGEASRVAPMREAK